MTGWFRRSMGGSIILSEMTSAGGRLRARPYFWQMLLCMLVIGATLGVAAGAGPRALWHPAALVHYPTDSAPDVETEAPPE